MKAETRAALDRFLNRYIAFICRHPVKVLLFALLSASLSVHFASRLQLKTDFVELLPKATGASTTYTGSRSASAASAT